jgi:hypothetical protein
VISISEDSAGNKLYQNGTSVMLYIAKEERHRNIGNLVVKKNGVWCYYKSVSKRNLFRTTNSIGINYALLEKLPDNAEILIFLNHANQYILTKNEVLKHGSFLHFKTSGFEKQIFVPIEKWRTV